MPQRRRAHTVHLYFALARLGELAAQHRLKEPTPRAQDGFVRRESPVITHQRHVGEMIEIAEASRHILSVLRGKERSA